MTKLKLSTDRWFLNNCLDFVFGSLPPCKEVAFIDDEVDPLRWEIMSPNAYLASEVLDRPVSWITIHGFVDGASTVVPTSEDFHVFPHSQRDGIDPAYRQNPRALWEFYVWDSTCAFLVVEAGDFKIPRNWKVDEVRIC